MRSFIQFFTDKVQFTYIVIVGLIILGINSLLTMPRSEDPEMDSSIFTITVVLPGALPSEIQEQIIKPIEDRFSEQDAVKQIKAIAWSNLALIIIEYDYEVDRDNKHQEVIREIGELRSEVLPKNIQRLSVNQIKSMDVVISQIALQSDRASYAELEKYATSLKDKLNKIDGIQKVEVWGYPEQEVRVELNIEKLAELKIPIEAIANALQRNSYNIPAGDITTGNTSFSVKVGGEYKTIEEIENTIVYNANKQIIRLKDVAYTKKTYEDEKHLIRLNGVKAVLVTTSLKTGYNITSVAEKTREALAGFSETLPETIVLEQHFDQSISVSKRLKQLGSDFIIAILLVAITLLPLGFRSTLVVMISIPLSLAIGIIGLDLLGHSLNQLSIVGLILALGILVDDSIVVNENIERTLRSGVPLKKAVIDSTSQIATAVIGVTVTLIIAFIPILFLPGVVGEFARPLPLAVILTVLASLFVSLAIVPFISSRILKDKVHPEGNIFLRGLNKFIHFSYGKLMDISLRNPKRATLIVSFITLCGLLVIPGIGFNLFPKSDKPQFYIEIETPPNASLEYTDSKAREVEAVLEKQQGIKHYTVNVGKGNPQVYYNVEQQGESNNYANVFVQCEETVTIEQKKEIIDALREKFGRVTDAKIQVMEYEQGPPLEAPVAIRLFGNDMDTLRKYSIEIENIIKSVEGTSYVQNPLLITKTGLKIDINKEKATLYGINNIDIDNAVRMAISGYEAGEIQLENVEKKSAIKISLPKGRFPEIELFDRIYVPTAPGNAVPLKNVATIAFEKTPNSLTRIDKELYTTVSASAMDGYLYNDLNTTIARKLESLQLPAGYYWKAAGDTENQENSFAGFGTILAITLVAFLAALVLEFKSFKSSLIVLSVIPLGFVGGMMALFITGSSLSFISMIGFIALVGIEIKNSILLVDYTNYLRKEENMPLKEAVAKAGEVRFVPILLTTMTAIAGMIPLIIQGSPLYSPLALVIVGGLISSLLLSRILTPVLYLLLPPQIQERTQ